MSFVTIDELTTHLFGEVIESISEGDNAIPQAAIDAAIDEAKGYLSRYDIDVLFAKTPKPPQLLMRCKDIAVWHFLVLSNQSVELEFRELRYDQAISWLKDIQSGKVMPKDWPVPAGETYSGLINYGSNPKRNNHY